MSSVAPRSGWEMPAPARRPAGDEAALLARARAVTHEKATTFALACRFLPGAIRDDVYRLYLVFRTLDDLVDEGHPEAHGRVEATAAWAQDAPVARTPEVALLEDLAERHPLPRPAVADFCAGMRQDLGRARFATDRELDLYCYRVAGTVGVVMAAVLGAQDRPAAARSAAALGKAMQRTNILRDVDEDLAAGRLYLPLEALSRHGALATAGRGPFVREQIARADDLYDEGIDGIGYLTHGRRAIAAAASMYREILREIERRLDAELPGRAVVPTRRKLGLALGVFLRA